VFSRIILLMLLAGYAFGETNESSSINGKYQATSTEKNITGTHTHMLGWYLSIDTSKTPSVVYFSVDNGDIYFGKKSLFILENKEKNKYELRYAGCITQSSIGEKESACSPSEPIGKIIYKIEVSERDTLKINDQSLEERNFILKKVNKFDFE
jgi:hypothetical protein